MAIQPRRAAIPALATVALGLMVWTACGSAPPEAGGPAGTAPMQATFVGTATCAGCHEAERGAWAGSHHDLAMQPAGPDTVLGDFDDARVTDGDVTSTFSVRDGRYLVRTNGPDGTLQDFEVAYTFGVEPLQQYLVAMPDGRLQPLSIAWDTRPAGAGGQRWFRLYPGQAIPAGDPLHWTGRAQNWNFTCADCHSTGLRKGYDAGTDTFETTWAEVDVGCEACHGPGSRHVAWAGLPAGARGTDPGLTVALTERRGITWRTNGVTRRPVRSAPLTTSRELQVCAQCHSRRGQIADGYTAGAPFDDFYALQPLAAGLYHPDGQPRDEVYVYGSFLESRMHAEGVTCSDCHDPHSQRLLAPGNALCTGCHQPAVYDTPAHTFHDLDSDGAQCVSCHMPRATYMVVDPRRDHGFRVPRPDLSVSLGVPNACTSCHADRTAQWAADAVRGWLGRDAEGLQDFAGAFAAAERGEAGAPAALRAIVEDAGQPAIVRAAALSRLQQTPNADALAAAGVGAADTDPLVRRVALELLQRFPPRQRGAAAARLTDPSRAVRIQAALALAPVAGQLGGADGRAAFERATADLIASFRYNDDRAESRLALGGFLADLGRTDEAAAEYRAAIRLAPDYAPAYVNLAELVRLQGREQEAAITLREGLAAAPDDPTLHHALGLSLVRAGDLPGALAELARAVELGPDRPEIAYAYAVALNSTGQPAAAIAALEQAVARTPRDRDLLFALATFHRDAGNASQALDYAERLAAAFPADTQAQALVESLR